MPAPVVALSSPSRSIFHQGSGDKGLRTIVNVSLIALSILVASLCFAYGNSFLAIYSGVALILGAAVIAAWTRHKNSRNETHDWKETAYSVAATLGAPIAFPAAIACIVSHAISVEVLKETLGSLAGR